ncbi:cytochrome aa3 quinol oxidase subunit III [Paenibacillus sp. L3-i20]|uniref:cytochrome aa3 quinol oxidase subunit III n=1 Tax=Paenibacillus sp. L3-i20 TaxID=2905833 RepID=UPI001EDF61CD|nr:cytochrome aa3 quinol oxidase subunit III [Paenibacillus sp. L3-i20]GKU79405.1 quinol oxidase subunit 3 [Paenibacillus sp. L3-i20]
MAHSHAPGKAHETDMHTEHHEHPDQEGMRNLGFWIYLMTDVILFGTFFATYIVLRNNTNGGPGPAELFEINGIIISTFILLFSSYTCGLALLAMNKGNRKALIGWLGVTVVLGLVFIGFEINEFAHLVSLGATMGTSAFLSAFYTLVGTHGLHVIVGIVWMVGVMIQISRRGITPVTKRKVNIVSLFWHFLDVVWIFVFTVVYLMGVS